MVRYIHLNPLRAKLVKSIDNLDRYRWSGHGVLMGKVKNEWQDRDYVLKWFGNKEAEAKIKYQFPVKDHPEKVNKFIAKVCKNEGVSIEEIKAGSPRRETSRARARNAIELVKTYGVSGSFDLRDIKNIKASESISQLSQQRPLHYDT